MLSAVSAPTLFETVPDGIHDLVRLRVPIHAARVALLAHAIAPLMGVNPSEAFIAGYVHDIGKVGVPLAVLEAPRPLTAPERRLMQDHPIIGAALLAQVWPECSAPVQLAVRSHHERMTGQGYPFGLCELSPLTAVVAAADVWDALRSPRAYRAALNVADAGGAFEAEALPGDVKAALWRIVGEQGW
jgi:HD-GYP domain-containing protein (c-di-GMP phosphodiesterase class II)